MKHNKKLISCILACALVTMPLTACGKGSINYENFPDTETDWIEGNKPEDSSSANTPNTDPSTPDMPVLPPSSEDNSNNNDTGASNPPDNEIDAPTTAPDTNVTPSVESVSYICTKTSGLNIRSGPSTAYAALGKVESGVLLKFDGRSGDFYKTTYLNSTAYVSANPSYTSIVTFDLTDADDGIEQVIDEGLKVLGTPYVYGAVRYHYGNGTLIPNFTVTQFDCSSLMQYIFYKGANKMLDMTSRAQSLQGTAIDKSEIKRGDLLFFTNVSRYDKTGLERIGHVALYLGNNYILHTASDYAKVEQISSTRWSYYICARRIID